MDEHSRYARLECNELVDFAKRYISFDGMLVPGEQREWRIGKSHSWHYVKIVEYRTSQLIICLENIVMAQKGKKRGGSTDFASYVFVRCELSPEDKKSAKIWIEENTTEFGSLLHDAVASDYKFSLSFSSEHDTFTACLVGKEDNAVNGKKTLTARHRDWTIAGLTVLYKHMVMFQSGPWEDMTDDEDGGWA